jgi:hypothetical protein
MKISKTFICSQPKSLYLQPVLDFFPQELELVKVHAERNVRNSFGRINYLQ